MLSPNEVHLADLDAVPTDAILCARCGKTIVSRFEQQVAAGTDFLNKTRHRVRLLVPLRKMWHAYHAHYDLGPLMDLLLPTGGLTAKERARLRYELRKVSRTGSVYAARRRLARRLGGRPGEDAERTLQAKFPNGIPARLTVYHTVLHCEPAMTIARERMARKMERINTLHERKFSRPELQYDFREIINEVLDQFEAELKEEKDQAPLDRGNENGQAART